jgi:hypothetical protein
VFSTLTTAADGGTPESYARQAPPFTTGAAGAVFAKGAGAAFFSTVSLQVNGILMGTISNPAQIGGVLSLTDNTNDYAETVGSSELLQTNATARARNTFGVTDSNDAARSAFEIIYRPPIGFLRTMKAFPGARITLTFNVAPEYGSRVLTSIDPGEVLTIQGKDVAAPTAATDHKVQLTSIKYYAATMTPLNNPSIPSQVLVPQYEIASSAHQLTTGLI